MNIFERLEQSKLEYRGERRAHPQFAKPYFQNVLHHALELLGGFALQLEKVRQGQAPENPLYQEHYDNALIILHELKNFGFSGMDLFAYSRESIDRYLSRLG